MAPTFVTQPQAQASPSGELVKFTAAVRGGRPLRYQWRFNGRNLAGATNSALMFELLQTNRVGNYSVSASNALGSAISSNAALTLLPPPLCTDPPRRLDQLVAVGRQFRRGDGDEQRHLHWGGLLCHRQS